MIRFLLIFLVIILILRPILRLLFPFILKKAIKNVQQNNTHKSKPEGTTTIHANSKFNQQDGDFVEYEEIKD